MDEVDLGMQKADCSLFQQKNVCKMKISRNVLIQEIRFVMSAYLAYELVLRCPPSKSRYPLISPRDTPGIIHSQNT